jgi:hypothetical protein
MASPKLPSPLKKAIESGVKLEKLPASKSPDSAYMHAALQAIEKVRSEFGILAANRDADQAAWAKKNTGKSLDDLVDDAYLDADANTPVKKTGGMMGGEERDPKDIVKAQADAAIKHKAGNCEMQAAVAFEFLKQFKVPLDIMYLQMYEKNAAKKTKKLLSTESEDAKPDHVFVVIGRPKATDPTNYETWGPNPVVCDSWARLAYRAARLGHELEALGTISAGQTKTGLRLRYDP